MVVLCTANIWHNSYLFSLKFLCYPSSKRTAGRLTFNDSLGLPFKKVDRPPLKGFKTKTVIGVSSVSGGLKRSLVVLVVLFTFFLFVFCLFLSYKSHPLMEILVCRLCDQKLPSLTIPEYRLCDHWLPAHEGPGAEGDIQQAQGKLHWTLVGLGHPHCNKIQLPAQINTFWAILESSSSLTRVILVVFLSTLPS